MVNSLVQLESAYLNSRNPACQFDATLWQSSLIDIQTISASNVIGSNGWHHVIKLPTWEFSLWTACELIG